MKSTVIPHDARGGWPNAVPLVFHNFRPGVGAGSN